MASQSNMSVTNQPTRVSEEEYHREIAILMVPGMVILGLMMLIGLFGNILVLYVYTVRLKRSTTNLFIIALAVSDIVVCSVCIPIEIVVIRYLYSFDKPWLCRVMRTIVLFCVACSISVLVTIAVDRYKRICTPFGKQITFKTAKIAIGVGCVLSAVLASPSMVILGSKTVNTTFTGHACATDDSMIPTPYPGLFNGMQFVIAVGGTATVSVLYSLILRKVKMQEKYRKDMKKQRIERQICELSKFENETSRQEDDATNMTPKSTDLKFHSVLSTNESVDEVVSSSDDISTSHDDDVTTSPRQSDGVNNMAASKSKHKPKGSHKTTFMMFLVTAVFVVSFIPHLGLMATRAVQKHTFEYLEGVSLAAYNIFLRIHFINSVSNPIIYSFLSVKFRREVIRLFKRPHPAVV